MDRTFPFLLLLGVIAFFVLGPKNCQARKPGQAEPAPAAAAPQRATDRPVFPSGPAADAVERQLLLDLDGAPGEPAFRAEFDTRGASLRRLWVKDFTRQAGQDPGRPEHWEPLIDPGVFEAGPGARSYSWFSFALEDPQGKLNLFQRSADQAVQAEPYAIPWHFEQHAEGPEPWIRFSLPLTSGLTLVKEYRFPRGKRHFDLIFALENREMDLGGETRDWNFVLSGASVVPSETFVLGPKQAAQEFYGPPQAVAVVGQRDGGALESAVTRAADGKPDPGGQPALVVSVATSSDRLIRFAGSYHKFFACLLAPRDPATAEALTDVQAMKVPWDVSRPVRAEPYSHIVPKLGLRVRLPEQGGRTELAFHVFAGPKDVTLFEAEPLYADFKQLYLHDLGNQSCFCPVPGLDYIGRLLLWLLRVFHSVAGNWGVAIIMLTVLVRIILVPLNYKSQYEMARYQKRMSAVKPLMDAIKKKYEKNRQRLNQEMVKLQREHKITPPLMGCLPMFVTIPVFLGLFTALRVSFDLRHQPFIGWIRDLSMPDRLLRLHENSGGIWNWIPAYLNVLPLAMTALWWFQQRLMPRSDDPQQKQMQMMMQFMPIVFGFMLYNYAAGLALYMTVSSIFGILEARVIRKRVQALAGVPAAR